MLPNLQILNLSGNTLTGCLSSFLPDSHPGLPQLKKLDLGYTALKKEDLQQLLYITQHSKLPKLEELYLSGNTLTGYLSSFTQTKEARLGLHGIEQRRSGTSRSYHTE